MNKFFNTKTLVRSAFIAALYVALTFAVWPLKDGAIQFRISEALTILPLFFPESIVGLTVGCFIANIFGNGWLDLIFGTLATLLSAVITFLIGRIIKRSDAKVFLGILPPIIVNAFVVPVTFLAFMTSTDVKAGYWLFALSVGGGQAGVLIVLGLPLYFFLKSAKNSHWARWLN